MTTYPNKLKGNNTLKQTTANAPHIISFCSPLFQRNIIVSKDREK